MSGSKLYIDLDVSSGSYLRVLACQSIGHIPVFQHEHFDFRSDQLIFVRQALVAEFEDQVASLRQNVRPLSFGSQGPLGA